MGAPPYCLFLVLNLGNMINLYLYFITFVEDDSDLDNDTKKL